MADEFVPQSILLHIFLTDLYIAFHYPQKQEMCLHLDEDIQ